MIKPANDERDATRLLGASAELSAVLEQVSSIAELNKPVLVVGERGTGKELIAKRLHFLSPRWDRHLETMNCAAISDSLMESELFGHESGAFTGAQALHKGRFERADHGSLFLDELATTSARVQEQLLRVIEYGEFQRLGGSRVLQCDVRLIAATNEDLPSLAEQGAFRADLLDRLSFDVITLPPLRARRDDIPELATHFATAMSRELGRDYFAGFSEPAMSTLLTHDWPGNVRELKNAVERSTYQQADWQAPLINIVIDPFDSPYRPTRKKHKPKQLKPEKPEPVHNSKAEALEPIAPPPVPKSHTQKPRLPALSEDFTLRDWLDTEEKRCIEHALNASQHKQKEAARSLGLSYHQLRASLRKFPELKKTK